MTGVAGSADVTAHEPDLAKPEPPLIAVRRCDMWQWNGQRWTEIRP